MKRVVLLFVFIVAMFISCSDMEQSITSSEDEIIRIAEEKFVEATKLSRKRENWLALSYIRESEDYYSTTSHPSQHFNKYLLKRQKALLLNRENLSGLAAEAMTEALSFLYVAKETGHEMNFTKEEVSTLRYKASYLRNDYNFTESNEIIFNLLKKEEVTKGLHAQLKNRIGRNFYDLFDYESAYTQFNDILKRSDLDAKMKAHYLQNRSQAAYKLAKKDQAFSDMRESIRINDELGREVYSFTTRMDLGELLMQEKDYKEADRLFSEALTVFANISEDPDLFIIYNHRYVVASVLGLDQANEYKRTYDSLNILHQSKLDQYTAGEESFILKSKLDDVSFGLQDARTRTINIVTMALSIVGFLLLALAVLYLIAAARKRAKSLDIAARGR